MVVKAEVVQGEGRWELRHSLGPERGRSLSGFPHLTTPAVPGVPGSAGVGCKSCLLPRMQSVLATTTTLRVLAGTYSYATLCSEKLTQAALSWCQLVCTAGGGHG